MDTDQITALKKTLKKWETAFRETHEKKPSRTDIESAPQRIQDAYRDYNKLRKGGGTSNESTKDASDTATKNESEVWGSHLNKSNASSGQDKESGANHEKGTLLTKLSQKLYQNYSHSNKTPKRTTKSTTCPENVLQESALGNGEAGKADEAFDVGLTNIFSSQSQSKHSTMKVTNTSRKLHSQKLNDGPACSNILVKSKEKKHSLKTDWLDKCKPAVQSSRKVPPKRNDTHDDAHGDEFGVKRSSEKMQEENGFMGKGKQNTKEQKCEESKATVDERVMKENSVGNEISFVGKDAMLSTKDCDVATQSNKDKEQANVEDEFGTNGDNYDKKHDDVTRQSQKSKRKRSEDFSGSSKRMKESEEMETNSTPQLSSYEAFEIPDDGDVIGQSEQVKGQIGQSGDEDVEKEENQKQKKRNKKVKISKSSPGISAGGSAPSRNLNENYVRLNMKYKSYSRGRGPGRLKGEAYKRHVWKQRQKGELGKGRGGGGAGRGRGRGGGGKPWLRTEDTCFKCGNKGHWASNCIGQDTSAPKKDIEEDWTSKVGDDEEFPTLEEAALAAAGIKPDKEAIANGLMTAPTVRPPVYEDPVPPPPIEPLFPPDKDGKVIVTPETVMDALKDMGFTSFRPGQEHSVMRILSGLSTLVVLSTGAGKSLTYQLPAYIYAQRSPCITLVISPLVSLMDDQIFGLPKCLKGARLHSNMTKVQREKVVKEITAGNVNVLLISPEAVVGGGYSGGVGCLPSLDTLPPIAFACIDEAHCVSEWSHNFRPSYLMLCRVLRERLGVKCLLGLTATATMATASSVAEHLGIAGDNDAVVRGSSVPNNLKLSVSRDPNRERAIVELLEGDRFRELDSIIVYCIRRDETEKVASLLRTCLKADPVRETSVPIENTEEEPIEEEDEGTKKKKGKKKKGKTKKAKMGAVSKPPPANSAESYHAGMSPAQRRKVQNAFMCSKLRIVVATVAFGMGLDKADVRAVIHYNLPKSYESYVQEIGRAGRDGKPSHCHVFLEPEGSDLCELRRHTYANSMDRIVIKKLANKVFLPCKCRQLQNLNAEGTASIETTQDNQNGSKAETSSPSEPTIEELQGVLEPWDDDDNGDDKSTHNASVRLCPGHQVAIPTENLVQELDIKEESIATLLCYLELHSKRWIRNLPPLYATCNIICYGGPTELRETAKKCPPVAVAIAKQRMKGKDYRHSNSVEFNAVEVASSMGWDVVPVKKELRQLQWKQIPGRGWVKSGVLVEFSDVAMSMRAPGDMTDDDFDEVINFLADRTTSQEHRELYNLQSVYTALHSVSCKHYAQCCDSVNEESSDKLKEMLREYFQAENTGKNNYDDLVWFTPDTRQRPEAQEGQVRSDVRQFIGLHHDRTFTGRAVARIFHGIQSPCYPAQVWGRDRRFWRRHLDYDFNKLVKIATAEVLRMR